MLESPILFQLRVERNKMFVVKVKMKGFNLVMKRNAVGKHYFLEMCVVVPPCSCNKFKRLLLCPAGHQTWGCLL